MRPDSFPANDVSLITNGLIMLVITFGFVWKVRFGIPSIAIQPHKIGKASAKFFLILYFLYIILNYFLNKNYY